MLKRRTHKKPRRFDPFSIRGHLAWVRGFECAVSNCSTGHKIQSHHHKKEIPQEDKRGMSGAVHDKWAGPLCVEHHREVHDIGADSFDQKYGIKYLEIVERLWAQSPHRITYERRLMASA